MKYSVLILLFLVSCKVHQSLTPSNKLTPGMTMQEVEDIMGAPAKTEFDSNVLEWHYCRTGFWADEYVALFFMDGKLMEKTNYMSTPGTFDCAKYIKTGNYREPDLVIEIRGR